MINLVLFALSQMVEEDMQGEVVMVRLGADEGGMDPDQDQAQGSSFVQLKSSATLLVPLELVEEQQGLVDGVQLGLPELQQTFVPDDPRTETRSSFSLMLDMEEEEGDREAFTLPIENDLQSSNLSPPSPSEEPHGDHVPKPEVILLDTDHQEPLQSGDPSQEDQGEEVDSLHCTAIDGLTESEPVKLKVHLQTENSGANPETQEKKDTELVMLTEDHEPAAPLGSLPAAVNDTDSAAKRDAADEEIGAVEDKHTPAEHQEEPEKNGPVNIDAENASNADSVPAVEEQQQDHTALDGTEEHNAEEIKEEEPKRKTRGRQRKDSVDTNSQPEEPSVPETPTSQRKKAPSTPTRMTTRGRRTVTFISPLPEEAEEPVEDKKVEVIETSIVVPASPSRTPRKTKPIKEAKVQPSTPRRSTRKAQLEPPKEEIEVKETVDNDTTAMANSKAPSPARKRISRGVASTRSNQMPQSGSEEVSTSTEVEDAGDQQEEVTDKKVARKTGTKTPTPAKRRATQENTPRRSRRRILSSSEVESTPREILEEEGGEAFDPPESRSSRKIKTEPSETQPAQQEEEEDKKQQPGSPGRLTRQSNRISLTVYPQVTIPDFLFMAERM